MKTIVFAFCLTAAVIVPQAAVAGHHHEYYEHHDYRESRHGGDTIIIEVEPRVYHEHESHYVRQCRAEEIRHSRRAAHHNAAGGMVFGGIVGGVIGHQLARGHDRDAFALLGTLIGASLGHDMAYQRHHGERRRMYKKRCRLVPRHHHY